MPSLSEVEALCGHVVERDTDAALRLIEDVMRDGVEVEAIYANLLGASARMLGEMWERDQLSFIDVTVGLCSLHQILFRLSPDFDPEEPGGESARRALFAPTPGESHVFGALVVARFFSRAGWQTWTEISIGHDMLCDLVRRQRFDLVGLSISADRNVDNLARAIDGGRAAAGRHPLKVLIGGHSVDIDPTLVDRVGADAAAGDPAAAVEAASRLVDRTRLYA